MGKNKKKVKALEKEIARKPIETTGYKTDVSKSSSSVSDTLKSQSGPSMHGEKYNYKSINSCGPSMKGKPGLERLPEVEGKFLFDKIEDMPKLSSVTDPLKGKGEIIQRDAMQKPALEPVKKKFGEDIKRVASNVYQAADKKLAEIEGKHPGAKKMIRETAFSLAESGLKYGVGLIAGKRTAAKTASQQFRDRFASSGSSDGYVSDQRSPSYSDLEKKYSKGMFG